MKFIGVLMLVAICALSGSGAVLPRHNNPVGVPTQPTQNSLAQDLSEITRLIPRKEIQRLIIRYLLNDAQFQTFVRIINSYDGYITQVRFRSQPEVMAFVSWVRSQIMLSGTELDSSESNESLEIINHSPFWSQNVFGWQGFVNEFHMYYPEQTLRLHAQTKAAQSAVFAQYLERLKGLKSAYDRVTATPEAMRLINSLQANGIDASAIDSFIRRQFGWQQAAVPVGAGAGAAAAAPQ